MSFKKPAMTDRLCVSTPDKTSLVSRVRRLECWGVTVCGDRFHGQCTPNTCCHASNYSGSKWGASANGQAGTRTVTSLQTSERTLSVDGRGIT